MKHLKLLIAAIAAMTSLSVNAQSWTASEVGAGDFYLYNVGKGQFLTRGNGWGTQASVSPNSALTLTLEEYNGAYKLRTNINGDGKGLERLADPVIYADQSAGKNSTWTFTKVADGSNGPVYTIVSKDNHGGGSGSYMTATAGADNTVVGPADAVTDDYGRWQLLQSWITNSLPVNDATGWTVSQTPTFDGNNVCAEFWNKSGATIKQTLSNLPAGSYELIAVALTRTGMTATLNAGSNTMSIATATTDEANNRSQANTWFNNGNGVNKLEFTHTGGNLEIGLTADNTTGDHWLVWRSFVLIYKGLDLTALKDDLQAQINAVANLEGTTTEAAYNAAKNYADGIDMDALTTEEAISAATTELSNLVNAATALQTNYARYKNVRAAALRISTGVDTNDADAAVAAATTNEAIEAAIATLRAALLAELPNLEIPEATGYIDVTDAMVDNASVRQNTDYWTIEGTPNGGYSWAKVSNNECEFYQQNFKFYQTLALTPGTWEFGVTGFHRAGNHNTHFYAGEDQILIPGVANTVVNSMAEAQTYFDNGNGKVALKFLIETAGNVEIGINNQDTETDKWTIFRDFTLKYYGAPDYSVYQQNWEDAVTAAEAALANDDYKNVTGTERSDVTVAIADAPDGSSKANYLEKIQALEAATNTLVAAADSYNEYVAEKGRAALLGVTPENEPTSAEEAVDAAHALQVAEFAAVKTDYPYNMTDAIGDFGTWTGTATVAGEPAEPNYLDYEHWSDTTHAYYEQAAAGWGNAGGWTIQYEKTAKLPAGDYVIKVAARSSAGTTSLVSCTATNNTVTLPNVGAASWGIDTEGNATWNPDVQYANDNKGFGWQWRYLPFHLDEATVVTMRFYAEATTQYQWMSISDGQLLAKQEFENQVTISDSDLEAPEMQAASKVVTDRKLLAGLNTVVFPFDVTAEEIGAEKVLEYNGTTEVEGTTRIQFKEVEQVNGKINLKANVPYVVMVEADQTEDIIFNSIKNIAPAADLTVADVNGKFDFVGTYKAWNGETSPIVVGDYIAGADRFRKAAGGNALKAYRAYLKKVAVGEVKVAFDIDGVEVTGIEAVEMHNALFGNDAIYNLNGQRVNATQRGIYIVNGKKVVIK